MESTIALLAIDFCNNVPEVTIRIMEKQITVRILISLNIVKGDYLGTLHCVCQSFTQMFCKLHELVQLT